MHAASGPPTTAVAAELHHKIESRQAGIGVIGLGYVGLPLAVAFGEAGFRVVGIDVDQDRVDTVNRGESFLTDVASAQVAQLVDGGLQMTGEERRPSADGRLPAGSLRATTDYGRLSDVDVVIICVPTPLGKTKDPDMSHIVYAADEIARHLRRGMLIVLESTTYPGTTEELILPRLEGADARPKRGDGEPSGAGNATPRDRLAVGRDFFLAFSPERVDPGREDWTIRNTPKVIGGMTPACLALAQTLYGMAIERIVPVSSPRTAEMVKLLENTFRAVNIALVNEIAIMCDRLDIDVWEVIEAAQTKPFGFMPFYPGPGLGGHCIPVDPEYLAWKLKTINYNARFIQLAGEINFGMPAYVLGKIADALNDAGKPLNGSRVLVLGVAYKADVADVRESPALDLIHLLEAKGADVVYHDPFVPRLDVDGIQMDAVSLDRDTLARTDCLVIAAAHSTYDWQWLVENSRLVVDTRNATHDTQPTGARIVKL
jgi:UDP-N-acetyl-D-glucosamine dehydrogenase